MDVFRLLGAGASFNRKRYGQDMEIFQKKKAVESDTQESLDSSEKVPEIASELDFFGMNQDNQSSCLPSKKRKLDDENQEKEAVTIEAPCKIKSKEEVT
jgi:ATP-dependent RNA helicase DDX52/ROK1